MDTNDIIIPKSPNEPDEVLLADVQTVAEALGVSWLTQKQYISFEPGRHYSPNTLTHRFKTSWNGVMKLAGLDINAKRNKKNLYCPSKDALIEDVKAVAAQLGKDTITSAEYEQKGKYGRSCAYNLIGNWQEVLNAAGLKETGYHTAGVTDEQLLEAIYQAWERLGRQPNTGDLKNREMGYGQTTYINRFGSWKGSIIAFKEYVQNRQDNIKIAKAFPVTHKTSRTVSKKLRAQVFDRDQATCQLCGANERTKPEVKLVLDHIVPYSKGGETTYDNLQVLCSSCNIKKNNKLINKTK